MCHQFILINNFIDLYFFFLKDESYIVKLMWQYKKKYKVWNNIK